MKLWTNRDEQIERMVGQTVGVYCEWQWIAGKFSQEIEGHKSPALAVSIALER